MIIPWQLALTEAGLGLVLSAVSLALAVVSGVFDWYPYFTAVFILAGYYFLINGLLIFLCLGRVYITMAIIALLVFVAGTILAFAFHYKMSGLLLNGSVVTPSMPDSLYFSVTTFTTLGYGDYQPVPNHRLTTSIEALLGMVFMATVVSFFWLWFSENLIPREMTLLEGNRFGKGTLNLERMKIRTLTGKELKTCGPNDFIEEIPYYFDKVKEEWIVVDDPGQVPDDATVIVRDGTKFQMTIGGTPRK